MRLSSLPIVTQKEAPAEAEIVSHQLMLRSGMIRKLAAGIYTWLPMGLRVVRKIEAIVREEMDRAGGLELLMPSVQPGELWHESGRWDLYGPELLRFSDRHKREFCYGPTHEEVITDIARRELRSYKQLPVTFYQVQTKFRDEIRPRFGVMRSREFIMKDAYSFHTDAKSLDQTYQVMYDAYSRTFERTGLSFRAVEADSGAIGGNVSHEFHVLADSGEDAIAFSDKGTYAANVEAAPTGPASAPETASGAAMEKVATPDVKTIDDVSKTLATTPAQCVKTLFVCAEDEGDPVALILRGDHTLNAVKAAKLPGVAEPLRMAGARQVQAISGALPGSVGPIGLKSRCYVDHAAAALSDFVCGANEDGFHQVNVNWDRDLPCPEQVDIRNVMVGDPAPDGGNIKIARGIEVGHIFKLGTKYSAALGATVLDDQGKSIPMEMGCYGIGVTRIAAAAIEQNHDKHGIIWPQAIAPFQIMIIPLNQAKSAAVREASESLYAQLTEQGYEVLLDDREVRPGVKFADCELIGIPVRIVIGDRGLEQGTLEVRGRRDVDNENISPDNLDTYLKQKLAV